MSDWDTYWAAADAKLIMPCPPGHCDIARRKPEPWWRKLIKKLGG